MLFEVTDHDREVWNRTLSDFVPDRVIDAHTHVWLDAHKTHGPDEFSRVVSWPARVARDCSFEDLEETYRLLLPGRAVTPLVFSDAGEGDDLDVLNRYVADGAAARGYPALLFAHPTWSGQEVERRIRRGRFRGIKVYLSLAPSYLPRGEIRIFDFLPPHQLDHLSRNRRVVMLHIPRDDRLRDPVNLEQILEIERSWPGVKLILAHVGRAYCAEDMGDAFERLAVTRNLVVDISANTNDTVFEQALRTLGPERCLFGSDLPITRMRMRRVCEEGRYVNLVPRGLYGDVSADRNLRVVDPPESSRLTFFLYEEIAALSRACTRIGLGPSDVEAVFHSNARRLLGS